VRSLHPGHCVALICVITGNSQIRSHPYRQLSVHPAHRHYEHPCSPAPSSSSSGFKQPHTFEHRQGIAPQPMRHSFTHPGGWPDHPQRPRTQGPVTSTHRAWISHPPSYLGTMPSQEHLSKCQHAASPEGSTAVPQTAATHRDSVGLQRAYQRHHNVAEKTLRYARLDFHFGNLALRCKAKLLSIAVDWLTRSSSYKYTTLVYRDYCFLCDKER